VNLLILSFASLIIHAISSDAGSEDRVVPAVPDLRPCVLEHGSVQVRRKAVLPREVTIELDRLMADARGVAEAGEYFENTDAPVSSAPSARFIRAYHVRNVWFIWLERGGYQTVALAPRHDATTGASTFRVVPGSHFVGDLCAGTKAFFLGARSAG
jgi:hypothetical protein